MLPCEYSSPGFYLHLLADGTYSFPTKQRSFDIQSPSGKGDFGHSHRQI